MRDGVAEETDKKKRVAEKEAEGKRAKEESKGGWDKKRVRQENNYRRRQGWAKKDKA